MRIFLLYVFAVLWIGTELIVQILNTNDFQYSFIDTCIAVYKEKNVYIIKKAGKDAVEWQYPFIVKLIKEN